MTNYYLYNTETSTTEATEILTLDEVRKRNAALRNKGVPQRWVASTDGC